MRIRPYGHRILVEPVNFEVNAMVPESLKASGFLIKSGTNPGDDYRELVALEQGTLVAIGPLAWKHADYGYGTDDWETAWPKIGDRIIFAKYAGKIVTDPTTKKEYFLMNDDDAQMQIIEDDK